MTRLIAQFIVVFVLCCAAIFGAWLAGAVVTLWSFALATFFSASLVAMIHLTPSGKGPQ